MWSGDVNVAAIKQEEEEDPQASIIIKKKKARLATPSPQRAMKQDSAAFITTLPVE